MVDMRNVMRQSIKMMVGICLIWCLAMACPVHAEDSNHVKKKVPTYVKEGTYLGAFFVYNDMIGEFDGHHFFTADEVYTVPHVDNGPGFGIVIGGRTDNGAVELGYQRSSHDTSYLSTSYLNIIKSKATYNVIDLNFKIDVFARKQLRPYILFGVGIPWLTIKDGAYRHYAAPHEDETFIGVDLNLGAGVAYYFQPQWALTGGVIYRWNWFSYVEGNKMSDSVLEKAFGLTAGITYTF